MYNRTISGFTLKLIAIVFMLFEHSTRFLHEVIPFMDTAMFPAHYLGRIVAPIFFLLSVEGFFKTRNRIRYLQRIGLWLVITSLLLVGVVLMVMQIYDLTWEQATGSRFSLPGSFFVPVGVNIFTSILMGLLLLLCIEKSRGTTGKKKVGWIILCVPIGLVLLLFTEASVSALACYLIFYFTYGNKRKTCIFYIVWTFLSFLSTLEGGLHMGMMVSLTVNFQYFQILALPFILLYNGERGKYSWKYL